MNHATDRESSIAHTPSIAIVGSGPAGCYAAQFLRKRWSDSDIVIFDRLELPYGLVRYGVAPDHIGTKAVSRQFDRLFERDRVTFVGTTEIGVHVSLDELRAAFDVVVLATGLWSDRRLGIEGQNLTGVYGSGRVTRLINGHPDESSADIEFGTRVTIVGQGNVAIDLVRLLLSHPQDLLTLGVAEEVVAAIAAGPVLQVDVVGRSAVRTAKFDTAMVRELVKLRDVRFQAEELIPASETEDLGADGQAKHDAIAMLVDATGEASRTVRFHFGWVPQRVTGESKVTGIVFDSVAGGAEQLSLQSDSVLTAIGFEEGSTSAVQRAHHETATSDLDTGYLADGLYCVGWLRRGPRGTIPANRQDSKMVAEVIGAAFDDGLLRAVKPGLAGLAARPRVRVADYLSTSVISNE